MCCDYVVVVIVLKFKEQKHIQNSVLENTVRFGNSLLLFKRISVVLTALENLTFGSYALCAE